MSAIKTYSAKSKAVRALVAKGFAGDAIESLLVKDADGKWGFAVAEDGSLCTGDTKVEASTAAPDALIAEVAEQLEMNVTAEVVVVDEEIAEEQNDDSCEPAKINNSLASLFATPAAPASAKGSKKSKREAPDRVMQNDVSLPAVGTDCRKIWDELDTYQRKNGKPASAKASRALGESLAVNEFTMRTQYSRWRKFHGITGRVAD